MDKETLLTRFKPGIGEPDAGTQIYENLGLSARTLECYIDSILPGITDDAQVSDEFINSHLNILKSMGGQLRHEKAEFVKTYKPKDQPPAPEFPELESLKKTVEEMSRQIQGQQKQQNADAMRNGIKEKSKALKVQNQALWDDVVNATDITEGMTVDALVDNVKKAYESKLKAYFGEGAAPYGGNGGGSGAGLTDEEAKIKRENFRNRMKARKASFT